LIILKFLNKSMIMIILAQASPALAESMSFSSIHSYIADEFNATWESKQYEWYIPVNTWHNRASYSSDQISDFNENPWGLGMGKYRYDADGDWHGLYGMAFLDSHSKIEPILGYGFQKIWHAQEDLKLGLGYTVGVTFRSDMNYLPLPVILPIASVQYKSVAVQSTYVPGGEGYGNVLFTWLRWEIHN
jgi:palmitoyl transferase